MRSKFESVVFRVIMFISSYFPLYVMVAILNHKSLLSSFKKEQVPGTIMCFLILTLLIISLTSLFLLSRGRGSKEIKLGAVARPDEVIISYTMTYVIPLISGVDSSNEVLIVNFLLYLLIGYMYIRLNLIYLNPLWAIAGYIVYKEENERIIITDMSYESLKKFKNTGLKGYYISNDIFVAKKNDNPIL